jgi:hypothetical protein
MDELFAKENGIIVHPTSMRLATSNAVSTSLKGVTEPITIRYGTSGIQAKHPFLVVAYRESAPFRVLIGNAEGLKYGGRHDLGLNTLDLRIHWDTMGQDSSVVSFPLVNLRP